MSLNCPVPGCGYASNMNQYDEELARPLKLESTRSNEDEDAHRDMDDFDVDEELARLRRAVKEAKTASLRKNPALFEFIVEAFGNIDEHLLREGDLPRTWWSAVQHTDFEPPEERSVAQASKRQAKKKKQRAK